MCKRCQLASVNCKHIKEVLRQYEFIEVCIFNNIYN